LKELKELYVYNTRISNEGIKQLQVALPACRVVSQQ
jgi:hypothetical protein